MCKLTYSTSSYSPFLLVRGSKLFVVSSSFPFTNNSTFSDFSCPSESLPSLLVYLQPFLPFLPSSLSYSLSLPSSVPSKALKLVRTRLPSRQTQASITRRHPKTNTTWGLSIFHAPRLLFGVWRSYITRGLQFSRVCAGLLGPHSYSDYITSRLCWGDYAKLSLMAVSWFGVLCLIPLQEKNIYK